MSLTNPDDDPRLCIAATFRQDHYGEIDPVRAALAGVSPGEIRLYNGWPGPKGWGHRHVLSTPGRVETIQRIGFANERAYALAVGQGWTVMHEGDGGKGARIMVYMDHNGMWLGLALEWEAPHWSITTMLPFHSIGKRYPKLI